MKEEPTNPLKCALKKLFAMCISIKQHAFKNITSWSMHGEGMTSFLDKVSFHSAEVAQGINPWMYLCSTENTAGTLGIPSRIHRAGPIIYLHSYRANGFHLLHSGHDILFSLLFAETQNSPNPPFVFPYALAWTINPSTLWLVMFHLFSELQYAVRKVSHYILSA